MRTNGETALLLDGILLLRLLRKRDDSFQHRVDHLLYRGVHLHHLRLVLGKLLHLQLILDDRGHWELYDGGDEGVNFSRECGGECGAQRR